MRAGVASATMADSRLWISSEAVSMNRLTRPNAQMLFGIALRPIEPVEPGRALSGPRRGGNSGIPSIVLLMHRRVEAEQRVGAVELF